MEFYIGQNTTLHILKMQVVKDGKHDIDTMLQIIEESVLYFSMKDINNGSYKILNSSAGFVEKIFLEPNSDVEYYIYYKFSKNDTSKSGRFEGEFLLKSENGTLLLPIRDKLFINVTESTITT
jgi:hypothetical protein